MFVYRRVRGIIIGCFGETCFPYVIPPVKCQNNTDSELKKMLLDVASKLMFIPMTFVT